MRSRVGAVIGIIIGALLLGHVGRRRRRLVAVIVGIRVIGVREARCIAKVFRRSGGHLRSIQRRPKVLMFKAIFIGGEGAWSINRRWTHRTGVLLWSRGRRRVHRGTARLALVGGLRIRSRVMRARGRQRREVRIQRRRRTIQLKGGRGALIRVVVRTHRFRRISIRLGMQARRLDLVLRRVGGSSIVGHRIGAEFGL